MPPFHLAFTLHTFFFCFIRDVVVWRCFCKITVQSQFYKFETWYVLVFLFTPPVEAYRFDTRMVKLGSCLKKTHLCEILVFYFKLKKMSVLHLSDYPS